MSEPTVFVHACTSQDIDAMLDFCKRCGGMCEPDFCPRDPSKCFLCGSDAHFGKCEVSHE